MWNLAGLKRVAFVATVASLAVPRPVRGQSAPQTSKTEPEQCFGFSFGPWTPTLDWQRAGHGPPLDTARVPRAPGGRGWAAIDVEPQSDTTLILFPPWWPAGVIVGFNAKPTAHDTVSGRAQALVADGRQRPPMSNVRLWQIGCS
jgi:hypothetical protein